MGASLHTCLSCKKYTLKSTCSCGERTIKPRPPKFSLDDKYASYRRGAKKKDLEKCGLY